MMNIFSRTKVTETVVYYFEETDFEADETAALLAFGKSLDGLRAKATPRVFPTLATDKKGSLNELI